MKTVSLLLPVYNKEKFIEDTLRSIDKQYTADKFKIELVIVDDCCTDNSLAVMNNFKYANPNLTVKLCKTETNSGASVALNLALANSTGEYIAPHDADDLLTGLSLLKRFEALEAEMDYDWVSGNEQMMTNDGKLIPGAEFIKTHNWSNQAELQELVMGQMLIPAQSIMIRRSAIEAVKWDEEVRYTQDTWINYAMTVKGYKLKKIDDYVAIYRLADTSGSSSSLQKAIKTGKIIDDYKVIKRKLSSYWTESQKQWFDGLIAANEKSFAEQNQTKS
jgi:alpha-1,3-rhamnosyltransferase